MENKAKKLELKLSIDVYANQSELNSEDKKLVELARTIAKDAYAPYSNFHVGAAIKLDNGELVAASNQENAAYPSGMCAERVALYYAHSKFPNAKVHTIAITSFSSANSSEFPISPCGGCRQVIAEYEERCTKPIRIIMCNDEGKVYLSNGIENLLPLRFSSKQLK